MVVYLKLPTYQICDHVVDETVLVPQSIGFKVLLVCGIVDLLEVVLPLAIVAFKNGVLGRHVHRDLLGERHLEGRVRKVPDTLYGVIHSKTCSCGREVEDLESLLAATIIGSVDELELSGLLDDDISRTVLISMGVTSNDD